MYLNYIRSLHAKLTGKIIRCFEQKGTNAKLTDLPVQEIIYIHKQLIYIIFN